MKIQVDKKDFVQIECEGKSVAEIVIGDVFDQIRHTKEIDEARRARSMVSQLAKVNDWRAFADGVEGVTVPHPTNPEFPGVVAPPDSDKKRAYKQYSQDWHIGDFARRLLDSKDDKPMKKRLAWVRCSDRLPTEADEDCTGSVLVYDSEGDMDYTSASVVIECGKPLGSITHWKPTGLKRPEPPEYV